MNAPEPLIQLMTASFGKNWEAEEIHPDTWQLTMRFNSFEIKNSQGRTHMIKDFYVRFDIARKADGNYFLKAGVEGIRGELTYEEYCSDYQHSHIGGVYISFTSFCLGNTPLASMQTTLRSSNWFDWEQFEMYLYLIKSFIKWESLEGMPHRYIRNIQGGYRQTPFNSDKSDALAGFKGVFEKDTELQKVVKIRPYGNLGMRFFFDMDDPKLAEALLPLTSYTGVIINGEFLCRGTQDGMRKDWMEKVKWNKEPLFTFKGIPVYRKIIRPSTKDIPKTCTAIHPDITAYIAEHYQHRLNQVSNEYQENF